MILNFFNFEKLRKMTLCNDVTNEMLLYCDHMSLYNFLQTNKVNYELTKETILFEELYKYRDDLTFESVLEKGSLMLTKYLFGKRMNSCGLINSCRYGHLEIAKWLHSSNIFHFNPELAFDVSCINGHLEVAQWLLLIDKFHIEYQYVFSQVCKNGHQKIAKWLCSMNIGQTNKDFSFLVSCHYGYLEIAQWLYNSFCIDVHNSDEYAFRWSCINGHLDVSKWLYSLGNVDIHIKDNDVFKRCFNRNDLNSIKWLLALDDAHTWV